LGPVLPCKDAAPAVLKYFTTETFVKYGGLTCDWVGKIVWLIKPSE